LFRGFRLRLDLVLGHDGLDLRLGKCMLFLGTGLLLGLGLGLRGRDCLELLLGRQLAPFGHDRAPARRGHVGEELDRDLVAADPVATSTTSPRSATLSTSCRRMTCISYSNNEGELSRAPASRPARPGARAAGRRR